MEFVLKDLSGIVLDRSTSIDDLAESVHIEDWFSLKEALEKPLLEHDIELIDELPPSYRNKATGQVEKWWNLFFDCPFTIMAIFNRSGCYAEAI